MLPIPIVADREIRKHVDVGGFGQLVTLTGIPYTFHSGTSHVLRETNDVGVFSGPVSALPQLAIRAAGDDLGIPFRAAAVSVILVIGERGDAILSLRGLV